MINRGQQNNVLKSPDIPKPCSDINRGKYIQQTEITKTFKEGYQQR